MRIVWAVVGLAGMMVVGVAQAEQAKAAEPQIPTEQQKKAIATLQQKRLAVEQGSACPGALQARQQATGGAVMWTTSLEDENTGLKSKPQGLGVHVEFQGRESKIKAMELRVSYEPLGLKRMPVAPGTNGFVGDTGNREREKNFNLDREAAMRIGGDLLVGPAATITRVHLMSVTFADGSVWRAPSADACSVVPSRFMPVQTK